MQINFDGKLGELSIKGDIKNIKILSDILSDLDSNKNIKMDKLDIEKKEVESDKILIQIDKSYLKDILQLYYNTKGYKPDVVLNNNTFYSLKNILEDSKSIHYISDKLSDNYINIW